MKIFDTLKSYLPVPRTEHEAALKKERERLNQTLAHRQKEIEAERSCEMKRLDELVARLVTVQWRRHDEYSTFGLQLEISAQMLRMSDDPHHRKMIAEAIGHQVQGEILRSRFIQ